MDRKEHLQWCKDRATAYLDKGRDGACQDAYASFLSDMTKHDDTLEMTKSPIWTSMCFLALQHTMNKESDALRKWIVGWN